MSASSIQFSFYWFIIKSPSIRYISDFMKLASCFITLASSLWAYIKFLFSVIHIYDSLNLALLSNGLVLRKLSHYSSSISIFPFKIISSSSLSCYFSESWYSFVFFFVILLTILGGYFYSKPSVLSSKSYIDSPLWACYP